jgi:restriction endonuclease S subunit
MVASYYRPSRDEILLDSVYDQIDEIEEEIANLERIKNKLIEQTQFIQEDVTRKGWDV